MVASQRSCAVDDRTRQVSRHCRTATCFNLSILHIAVNYASINFLPQLR